MNTRRIRRYLLCGLIIAIWLLGPGASRVEAYIDPGTGSHVLSTLGIMLGVICTCCAIGFYQIKRCSTWVVGKIVSRRKTQSVHETTSLDP